MHYIFRNTMFLGVALLTTFTYGKGKECSVALDVGHSKESQGALSTIGIGEYVYNKEVTEALQKNLNDRGGIRAFIINPGGHKIKLQDRVLEAEARGADVFVSIHHDSVSKQFLKKEEYQGQAIHFTERDDFSGFGIFVSPKNQKFRESLRLAMSVGESLVKGGYRPTQYHSLDIDGERKRMYDTSKGVYRYPNLVVLKKTKVPAILIENGMIVNKSEERKIRSISRRKDYVNRIGVAIEAWCRKR